MKRSSLKRRRISEPISYTKSENKQPLSRNWFDLPFEMREMVIDRMDAKTRGIFAQCSKLCEKEVKNSKNYLYGIKIDKATNRQLYIGHELYDYNYCLEFVEVPGLTNPQSVVIYRNTTTWLENDVQKVIKWTKTENGSAEDVRKRYVKKFLEKYKKMIKCFRISDETFSIVDFDLKGLRSLEMIVRSFSDSVHEDLIEMGSMDLEQILQTETVFLPNTLIKFEDILNFEGRFLFVRSDDFNEENIKKYLKMWEIGEVPYSVTDIAVIHGNDHMINGRKITEGLVILNYEEDEITCRFRFRLTNNSEDESEKSKKEEWIAEVESSKALFKISFVNNCHCGC